MSPKVLMVVLACLILSPLAAAAMLPVPELSSIAYLVYDCDYDYTIVEQNSRQKRSIASITKLMALLCALEQIEQGKLSLQAEITASSRAASRTGTQIDLKVGDKLPLEDLLYAMALASANDAAVAVAEYVAGSEASFVRLMNAKAAELGLQDTHYVDCTGLLSIFSNNYSTAYDQARLLQVALQTGLFRQIISTPKYFLTSQGRWIKNSHPFLEREGTEGGKTGATTPAGHTLITSRIYHGRRFITVVLGARSRDVRNEESKSLMDWADHNLQVIISNEELITPVIVKDGVDYQVNGVLAQEFSVVAVQEGDLQFETEIRLLPRIQAPLERGDKLGELVVYQKGAEFTRLDIVAQQGTGLASWLRRIFNRILQFLRRVVA